MIHRTGTKPKAFRLYYLTYRAINTYKTENRRIYPTLPADMPPRRFSALWPDTALQSAVIRPVSLRFWPGSIQGGLR